MSLEGLAWEEPAGLALAATERAYLLAERRRIVYVAATRARDFLVLPRAGAVDPEKHVCGALLAGAGPALVRALEPYREGAEPAWAAGPVSPVAAAPGDGAPLEAEVSARWAAAVAEAARSRFTPASVSEESDVLAAELAEPGAPRKPREGRFGHRFGHTVHHALALVLRDDALEVSQAVRLAAARFGLAEHLDEAAADVRRALAALRTEGLAGPVGPGLQVEYPVAAAWEGGRLLAGYVDLVAAPDGRLDVIDVKTDAPPPGPVEETYREYAAQVRLYGRLLDAAGLAAGRHLRCGLLFTADGVMRWVAA